MEAAKSSQRKTRRSDGPIATPLEAFRQGTDSKSMRNALAELSMRLMDADDREEFRKLDGVTAIVDHLARIVEEQVTLNYDWKTCNIFGSAWEEYEVHDSLQFTLVAICHASIDLDIAAEILELGAIETLFQLLSTLPPQLNDYICYVLDCFRNLCIPDSSQNDLPADFVQGMWDIVLSDKESSSYLQEVAAEVLTNLTAAYPTRAAGTPDRLCTTLTIFLQAAADQANTNFAIALSDLLCNLCCDQSSCLLLVCELDTRRPRGRMRHSGVVYLAEITDQTKDEALKQSMEALVHNLSWSDPAGKRSIQKLGLSSYMNTFALESAKHS